MIRRRSIACAWSLAFFLAMAGCQSMSVFKDGQKLLAEGRVEESLLKFQEASRNAPLNAEYRSAYLATRERAVYVWTEQGDRARAAGQPGTAEQFYRRVLALDPGNVRARDALDEMAREVRHADLLEQARTAWLKTDTESAMTRLRTILAENPRHRGALELRQAIEEKTARRPTDLKLAAALRKTISIEFRDTPIKQVFEVFARTASLNFIFDKDVRSDLRTTIFLHDTTIQDAVSMVLLTNQLEQRVLDSNSILIYPNNAAKSREYQPLTVRTFFLNNADVKVAANTLRTIVKTRDLIVDERQNMIIMRDTPEAVRLAERLLALQDLPEPEVMLEVEVLEVKRTRLLELGIQWPSQLVLTPLSTTGGATVTVADLRNLNSNSIGAALNPATITARKEDGDANLLANPRIRSRNREKARILVGDRVPIITTTATATGFVSESVTYVDVGLKLEVEPTVYMDDEVAIKIALEVSTIVNQIQTRSGTVAYQIGTRNANSVLRLKDGENQVLAGLINNEDRNAGRKVPGLGDIPILGRLFGSQRDDRQKTEIVLSITPRILRNPRRPSIIDAEFDAGTEASLRNRALETSSGSAPTPGPAPAPALNAPSRPPVPVPPPPLQQAPPPGTPGASIAIPPAPPAGLAGVGSPAAAAPISAGTTNFTFQGPDRAAVGSTLTFTLSVQPGQPITSLPFALGFDPKLLDVVAVTEGGFMRQNGASSNFTSRVDSSAGRVFATVTRAGTDGAADAGALIIVTARALSAAQNATIQLIAASPIGVAGSAVLSQPARPYVIAITP